MGDDEGKVQEPLCQMILQPREGRQHVARGASPWNAGRHYLDPSPEGAKVGRQPRASVAPSALVSTQLGGVRERECGGGDPFEFSEVVVGVVQQIEDGKKDHIASE
jgi:hypothetical protein